MNNPNRISESLETIFWVKILKFFDGDPGLETFGSGMKKIRIRDKHPVSATPKNTILRSRVFRWIRVRTSWKVADSSLDCQWCFRFVFIACYGPIVSRFR
jgi:hypothetical protein